MICSVVNTSEETTAGIMWYKVINRTTHMQASRPNYVIDVMYCYATSSCSRRYKTVASSSIHMNRFGTSQLQPNFPYLPIVPSFQRCGQGMPQSPVSSVSSVLIEWHRKRRRLGTPLESEPEGHGLVDCLVASLCLWQAKHDHLKISEDMG